MYFLNDGKSFGWISNEYRSIVIQTNLNMSLTFSLSFMKTVVIWLISWINNELFLVNLLWSAFIGKKNEVSIHNAIVFGFKPCVIRIHWDMFIGMEATSFQSDNIIECNSDRISFHKVHWCSLLWMWECHKINKPIFCLVKIFGGIYSLNCVAAHRLCHSMVFTFLCLKYSFNRLGKNCLFFFNYLFHCRPLCSGTVMFYWTLLLLFSALLSTFLIFHFRIVPAMQCNQWWFRISEGSLILAAFCLSKRNVQRTKKYICVVVAFSFSTSSLLNAFCFAGHVSHFRNYLR